MDFRIFIEPQQGATYADQLAVARVAQDCGYDAFFRSDHYLAMGSDGRPGPTDSWITLAGLARETEGITLGTLVTSATFRRPGPLAISVAQVDQMSGGRVELGIGAGWFEQEHAAYGIPFPDVKERFDRFEEQLAIITGLWRTPEGERFTYDGAHYQITDSPALPKAATARGPRLIIGGNGPRRTPALAARYADEYNVAFGSVDTARRAYDRIDRACTAIDRDPAELTRSAALVLCCGSDDAEVARRAAAIGREVDELKANGVAGTPPECLEVLGRYAAAGVERVYLQVLDLADLDHLRLVADEVVPSAG